LIFFFISVGLILFLVSLFYFALFLFFLDFEILLFLFRPFSLPLSLFISPLFSSLFSFNFFLILLSLFLPFSHLAFSLHFLLLIFTLLSSFSPFYLCPFLFPFPFFCPMPSPSHPSGCLSPVPFTIFFVSSSFLLRFHTLSFRSPSPFTFSHSFCPLPSSIFSSIYFLFPLFPSHSIL
jgi:hypothetical protein